MYGNFIRTGFALKLVNIEVPFSGQRILSNFLDFQYHGTIVERYSSMNPKFYQTMKTILLLLTVVFASMAVTGCTNDEGEDLDVITPTDEEEQLLLQTEQHQEQKN